MNLNCITSGSSRYQKEFFTVRVIDEWNRLPETVLHCNTLSTFKKKLDCFLKNRGYD